MSSSHEMANAAITHAYDDAASKPESAQVYAEIAIAQALLAVADEIKANTAMMERKHS